MADTVPEELLHELSAALQRDPRLNVHEWPVSVSIEQGKVILDGNVQSIAAKRVALTAARTILGERPVVDRLRVPLTEPTGDLELRDSIAKALSGEPVFRDYTQRAEVDGKAELIHDAGPEAYEILIRVHDNVVTLSGRVGSLSHRRLVEVLIWWTGECETVHNALEVVPAEDDNDNEITDAVRIVLEKDPLVHAGQLRVGTAGGVVELDGYVGNEEEKKLAVLDAWYVPGVSDVVDRIETRG